MWWSDLRAIRNLARTRDGRTVLLSIAVVLVCVTVGSIAFASAVLLDEAVVDAVRGDESGELVRMFYALSLVLPLMIVFGLGGSSFKGELYMAPQASMFLVAPISAFAILTRAFVRIMFGWLLFAVALGLPSVVGLAAGTSSAVATAIMFPLAVSIVLAPLVAAQALLEVVLTRWFSNPRLRLAVTAVQVVLLFVIGVLVVGGIFRGEDVSAALSQWLQTDSAALPWVLEAPAALLAAAAGYPQSSGLLWSNLVLAALPLPLLWCGAALYRRSFEVFCVSGTQAPVLRIAARDWPATPLRSLLRLGVLGAVRVKSNLVAYVFLVVLMVLFVSQSSVGEVRTGEEDVSPIIRDGFALLGSWYACMLLLATLSCMSVMGDEQKNVALLSTAPLPHSSLLLSKMVFSAVPLVACYFTVILCSSFITGASLAAIAVFAISAPALLFVLLGLVVMVGTWPSAIRLHSDTPLASSLHSILPVTTMAILAGGVFYLVLKARTGIVACYYGHGPFAAVEPATACWTLLAVAWGVAGLMLLIAYFVALRNLAVLLSAQRD